MADVFLSFSATDGGRARQLADALRAAGWTVYLDSRLAAGEEFDAAVGKELEAARHVLVLWSHSSIESRWVLEEASQALEQGKLIPVLLERVRLPAGFREIHAADLSTWTGDHSDWELRRLIDHLAHADRRREGYASVAPHEDRYTSVATTPPPPPPPVAAGGGIVKRLWDLLRPRHRTKSPPQPSPSPAEPEPVLLGVSAPRRVEPGSVFSARFVAYVEALEERVRQQLKELGGDEAQSALGIAPERAARWRPGTPVTVRLDGGSHIGVRPAEASFEWNGRHNLVSFSLTVAADAPAARAQLRFEAFIEGLPVAFIPLDIGIAQVADPARATVSARPSATAFASYSSLDAQNVALCLSALSRWDAGLRVFMDCLDLTPNESWQKELERVIPQQDAFFLFWSANAMNSKWVDWEWHHVAARKGIEAIHPFPLDDPAIAPPPAELQHLHFRDRYMMARQALARVAEQRK